VANERARACGRVPIYWWHKASGQAVVTLDGRDYYLGAFGSPESRAEYERVTGEWLRVLPGAGPIHDDHRARDQHQRVVVVVVYPERAANLGLPSLRREISA